MHSSTQHQDLSDIAPQDWTTRYLLLAWQPYARLARLDRPVGTWLTLLPCLAALVLAHDGVSPDWSQVLVFSLGALLMRSAGSTINDIWDRDFDRHVERTRFRPLTSGQVSLRQAVWFLLAQLALAASLLCFVNSFSRWLAVALLPLVIIYPLCKRVTYWPQAVLGAAFNWGMLMAFSDTQNALPAGAWWLWLGAIAWQIGYDTLYAYTDIADDAKLGLKSTARRFGDQGHYWLWGFYSLAVLCWWLAGCSLDVSWGYFVGLVVVALHMAGQLLRFDLQQPALSHQLFKANVFTGLLLLLSALAGVLS